MLILGIMLTILAAFLLACYICYRIAFYAPPRKPVPEGFIDLPPGPVYEPFYDQMTAWVLENRKLPRQEFKITSFDGLELWGTFYEYAPGAPIELMFHGYRGNAQRDLPGGVQRCFACRRSALVVDQRCAGRSGGKTITFGIRERRDCLAWVDFAVKHFGPDVKLILTGISMGAATVLMAAGEELPPNVIGILADCGYSTPKAIMQVVIGKMGLPPKLCWPFVRWGAKIFGGFDPEECSPLEAVARCDRPVIFFHGEGDDFVPCYMSREVYEACPGKKAIYTVPGADHGLSFPVDMDGYVAQLQAFFGPDASAE
jgi:pimeloyl-ACP methyl ester carboxylesterase